MAPPDGATREASGSPRAGSGRGRDGFFRLGQDSDGRWWLIGPDGEPLFLRGVHGVRLADVPADRALSMDSAARLRAWGFNAVGAGGDPVGPDDGFAFVATVDFIRTQPAILAPGVRLPDVFAPDWSAHAAAQAEVICRSQADTKALVGWLTDDLLEWGGLAPSHRPTLLQVCLSLEPQFAAYHAAWEFVLASHGGRLDAVARAWSVGLPNKEVVRELTRTEAGLATRGYLRDDARWAREFARRYFTATCAAIRAVDPNHLVIGGRFAGAVHEAVWDECTYPAIDVALRSWQHLPAGPAMRALPVLADAVGWTPAAHENATPPRRAARLTTFERMLRRARTGLDRMARHPAVVGYFWDRWLDEPAEQPPFARGLLHRNGTEARENTEVLTAFHLRAEALHRVAR